MQTPQFFPKVIELSEFKDRSRQVRQEGPDSGTLGGLVRLWRMAGERDWSAAEVGEGFGGRRRGRSRGEGQGVAAAADVGHGFDS